MKTSFFGLIFFLCLPLWCSGMCLDKANRLMLEEGRPKFQKIDNIIGIAEEAAKTIMEHYSRREFEVYQKGDKTLLTDADLASNQIIIRRLEETFPWNSYSLRGVRLRPFGGEAAMEKIFSHRPLGWNE